jgi:protein-histidine N-methyltransferase
MVPFADCLNHSNVQTKYDHDIDDNRTFRLFPTGANSYARGTEVFNSYGRRSNENLLLDYGFALPDNEWEEVD